MLPDGAEYTALREENWPKMAWNHPTCIATQVDAEQAASLVKVVVDSHVRFAIRTRGHFQIPGDSNIDTGVLISLKQINHVYFDAKASLVSMGPGARCNNVCGELDKCNWTMVGGRIMDVGVGAWCSNVGCRTCIATDFKALMYRSTRSGAAQNFST
ncbi:FAD binding domain-containing protein [Apiospora sp. TS-2023a]